jgi:SAM-dependent MidA family methyltransferase
MPPLAPPLDADEVRRVADVRARIDSASDASGFVPFDRFMELALYAEGAGYYAASRSPLGPTGDFYTAAHASPLFAATVAERVRAVRRDLGHPRGFRVLELGPGDGTLAAGIARGLGAEGDGVEYVLVDRSPERAREAERALRRAGPRLDVAVAASVGADGPFEGIVIANEFLDAQPARRLRWDGRTWQELGVTVTDGGLTSAERPLGRPVPGPPLPAPTEPGVVFEVATAAESAVREIGDHLTRGVAVLVDFGAEEPELLSGHPRGTLAAVRHHRPVDDPLESPGAVDLSTFVNFSRVRAVARASGLAEIAYSSQAEALGRWGLEALLGSAVRAASSAGDEVRTRLAAKNLLFGFEGFSALELAPARTEPSRPT